jgi:hexokinase
VIFRDSEIQREFQEVIRVEGKASQKVIERIYYDIYLTRRLNEPGYFIFESKSSVLNGLVEGPYFEESLSELEFLGK